ncbi:CHAT domain-containing protein [Candidatus Gracilibacteria bacterium]|nr:CHAT domain-containing protein [Candidatus Gracilibacteria bacterium]NJM90699.1 CHAT domain-containing protein [Hydrococcus sp. RU_2_2]NJP22000.1 CHAT domain-containing protein [Hydrococcus sp. CRU_1_1]
MARKRAVFFRSSKRRFAQLLLTLITIFLCLLSSPIFATVPSLNSIATESLIQQGKTFYEAGQFDRAIKLLQQAADAFKASGERQQLAVTLSNLSLAYQQLGQWEQAENTIAQSLDLLPTEPTQILAQTLEVRGRLQLARGQAQAALDTWQQSADIYAQISDETGIVRSRINQAQALQVLGLYRQAQKTLTEVKPSLQKQPDSALKAEGFRNIGNVLRIVGELKESRQILQESLAVAQASQSQQAIADTLLALGNTSRTQQDTKAALEFYQQAATISPSATTRIQAQLHQFNLLLEEKQIEPALALRSPIHSQINSLPPSRTDIYTRIYFAQSLMKLKKNTNSEIATILATTIQQAENLGDRRAKSAALGNLGKLYEQTQQLSEALNLTEQALFIAQAIDAPELAYQWQWQMGRILKLQGNRQSAIASYTEAINNLQSLRSDLVAINPDVQFSFREEVEPVYRQLVDLLLQSEPSQENLSQARNTIESLQLAELDNYFREACLAPLEAIDVVDPKAAIIYPIILEDRLEVILSLPGQDLRHYATKMRSRVFESHLEKLLQTLVLPYTSDKEIHLLSQEVYNWLIQPAEKILTKNAIETLVFVLDGSLRNLPMAALYDGKQYLIEKYNIALTPGLKLFEPKPLTRQQLNALAAGLSEQRFGFAPLQFVKRELAEIQSEIPSEILLDREFTSTTLNNKFQASPSPVVHIATHGQFSSQADNTFILAWDERINVTQLDRLLRARNPNKAEPLELLVLSACETAAGDERAALGLAGVAVRAGARSTLASLWLVSDESTALLMSHFYQELNTGVSKAEALRRAQQALLQGQYRHPYFWAAFVLLGNWL